MKKHILSIMVFCTALYANAQEYLHINSHWYENDIPVELIDSITYGEPSHADKLPAIMAQDPNISIFNEALHLTGMCDSIIDCYNFQYFYPYDYATNVDNNGLSGVLAKIKKGYTALVEPDSVYMRYGISNIEELINYASKVYDEVYPQDAQIKDYTNRRNSLNRFVSYHLLLVQSEIEQLTAVGYNNDKSGPVKEGYNRDVVDIADWYETLMPYSLLKCSSPYLNSNEEYVYINRKGLKDSIILVRGANVYTPQGNNRASNGRYHYIDDIIAYDRQTQNVVLDEQLIFNSSTLSPEFMNNGIRLADNGNPYAYDGGYCILPGSIKNVKFNSPATRLYSYYNKTWCDVQTDEFFITGAFDLSIKLPALPAGTYELCLGTTLYTYRYRPVVQFYLNDQPCGEPVDFNVTTSELGWISDEEMDTEEAVYQNDNLLYTQGWRKGLDFHYYYYFKYMYNKEQSLRNHNRAIRRIITTFTTDGKSEMYLRIKDQTPNGDGRSQFVLDFLEFHPTHLLNEYK